MTANKLQLNDNKTEAMIILSNRMSVHSPLPSVIHIGDADVPFVSSVKNLGVTLDSNLSMSQHISNTCKAAYIQIRHISSIRHILTTQATQTLVCSLVLSRLDYCNSLLSGCPQYLLDKLQKVQNAAARLVCKARTLHQRSYRQFTTLGCSIQRAVAACLISICNTPVLPISVGVSVPAFAVPRLDTSQLPSFKPNV